MSNILTFLLSFLLLYKYFALFGVVFLAAAFVPLPANTLLIATGAFASQGYFSFSFSLAVAVVANMMGDCLDFFLAQKYGRRVLQMLHIHIPAYFERLEHYVVKHPGPTIFLTRFVGTIEPLTSILCGYIGVQARKFIFYDFLGALVSNGIILYLGYFLGSYWQEFTGLFNVTDYILIALIVAAALFIILWRKKRNRDKY